MSTPQSNTKVELVVEAFEALAIAAATNVRHDAALKISDATFADVQEARKNAADALREFLKPTLRVVSGQ